MAEKKVLRNNEPQDIEDQHGPGYNNDASGWVRGAQGVPTCNDETATNYPDGNFDKGNAWRKGRGL